MSMQRLSDILHKLPAARRADVIRRTQELLAEQEALKQAPAQQIAASAVALTAGPQDRAETRSRVG